MTAAPSAIERARAAAARHRRDFDPRQAMPLCTAFIDDIRAAFGDPAGIRADEGGKKVVWGEPISTGLGIVPVLAEFGGYQAKPQNAFKRATAKIKV